MLITIKQKRANYVPIYTFKYKLLGQDQNLLQGVAPMPVMLYAPRERERERGGQWTPLVPCLLRHSILKPHRERFHSIDVTKDRTA